ncbi:hypothetical protein [Mucilaginibacter myungsuensis]|uniref:Uncharacterized protein n=1 Tax=Mucilaginibacter myungsuensis TaxID=649104 RepID=A0A929KY80_9SPHI|nr:hypothetical protein [Mucilaginibacter myungsuensis]MBE9663357.1 hypothetical protein [Mucilaginibacter myungsuensis]MDN3600092.1 hypothetical protein [Mucilaginibacter myungsuensis]
MTLQIDFPPEKEKEVMKALKSLGVTVSKQKVNKEKQRILNSIKKGLEEVELHQQGKIKLQSLDDLINEL